MGISSRRPSTVRSNCIGSRIGDRRARHHERKVIGKPNSGSPTRRANRAAVHPLQCRRSVPRVGRSISCAGASGVLVIKASTDSDDALPWVVTLYRSASAGRASTSIEPLRRRLLFSGRERLFPKPAPAAHTAATALNSCRVARCCRSPLQPSAENERLPDDTNQDHGIWSCSRSNRSKYAKPVCIAFAAPITARLYLLIPVNSQCCSPVETMTLEIPLPSAKFLDG